MTGGMITYVRSCGHVKKHVKKFYRTLPDGKCKFVAIRGSLEMGNWKTERGQCGKVEEGSGSEGECNLRCSPRTSMQTCPSQTPLIAAPVTA